MWVNPVRTRILTGSVLLAALGCLIGIGRGRGVNAQGEGLNILQIIYYEICLIVNRNI